MHMLFRTFFSFLKKNKLTPARFDEKTMISMRVMPTDLDFLWHVNNGVYFSFMDFGRMDMIFRNGVFKASQENGWYSVVASETIRFKKSLKLWDQFQIETEIYGYDDKYFFIKQKFLKDNDLMATGLVKVRFLRKGGGRVDTSEVLSSFKDQKHPPRLDDLSLQWFELEKSHLS